MAESYIKEEKKTLTDTENSMVITRGKGGREEAEEGRGGINGGGRRLDLGWSTHSTIYR